jgi:hypothetical protein
LCANHGTFCSYVRLLRERAKEGKGKIIAEERAGEIKIKFQIHKCLLHNPHLPLSAFAFAAAVAA